MSDTAKVTPDEGTWRVFAALAAVALVAVVLRFGWMSDDAFISFRAVANLVRGYGLVSNPPERVQAFTNPLWTLALVGPYAALRNIYWVSTLLSLACTAGLALILLKRLAPRAALLALLLLIASRGVVVFSTGGLENGLAHLLLVAFFLEGPRRETRPWLPWLLAGLIVLNRADHLLIIAPALVVRLRSEGVRASRRPALLGLVPLFVWLAFALAYYGFPWPNTAYAKLNTGIPRVELWMQGVGYLVDGALRDGMLPLVLGVFGLTAARRTTRPSGAGAALWGVALYIVYVAWIGGDFMGGRFLTAPYVVAALFAARALSKLGPGAVAALAGVLVLFGRHALEPLPVDPGTNCVVVPSGIVDERACYAEHTGIAQNFRARKYEKHPYFDTGLKLRQSGVRVTHSTLVGLAGFAAGPKVQIVDDYGLTDPLLARIRFEPGPEWRIGHFRRDIPAGYLESLESGENKLTDPCLRSLYDDVRVVTRGPLLSGERARAIWRLNFVRRGCRAR